MFTIRSRKPFCIIILTDEMRVGSNPGSLQVSALNTKIRTACVLNGHPENAVPIQIKKKKKVMQKYVKLSNSQVSNCTKEKNTFYPTMLPI